MKMAEELLPRCVSPTGSTGPRLPSASWSTSTCATCAASSPHPTIRSWPGTVDAELRRPEAGPRHEAGRGADALAGRCRGGAGRRPRRAGSAAVLAAAQGRRAVPGASPTGWPRRPRHRCSRRTARIAGPPCWRRSPSRRCARLWRRRRPPSNAGRADGDLRGSVPCCRRWPRCSGSRSPTGRGPKPLRPTPRRDAPKAGSQARPSARARARGDGQPTAAAAEPPLAVGTGRSSAAWSRRRRRRRAGGRGGACRVGEAPGEEVRRRRRRRPSGRAGRRTRPSRPRRRRGGAGRQAPAERRRPRSRRPDPAESPAAVGLARRRPSRVRRRRHRPAESERSGRDPPGALTLG